MRYLYIDIETLPCANLEDVPAPRAPANYKDPEKIAAYVVEAMQTAHRETSLDAFLGRVLAIGWAFDDEPVRLAYDENGCGEGTILAELADAVQEAKAGGQNTITWVGHNLAGFDLKWLFFRACKYGLHDLARTIPWMRWQSPFLDDTMRMSTGPGYGERGPSLNKLAKYFGLGGKTEGIDGSKIFDAWQAGEHDRIIEYCRQDVELVRSIHDILSINTRKA